MARVDAFVGDTPLIALEHLSRLFHTNVWAKLESRNPGGSIKDRTAFALLDDAIRRGKVQPHTVIIEATSGNTGIALAMACAARGLKLVVFMPAGQSLERKQLFWAYGATVIETPQEEGTPGAIRQAKALEQQLEGGLMLRQHENPANPAIHEETTGPEIWEETGGQVQTFVCGVGTGGTITGVGRFLKRQNPRIRIVAVEPAQSAVLTGGAPGPHKIQGIGAGFVPATLDETVIDEVIDVPDDAAWEAARLVPRQEGLLIGLSSGAVYWAMEQLLQRGQKQVVGIFADSGERYLSTGLFRPTGDEWLRERVPTFFDNPS
ncbi:MAG: cysteine synthase A [Firmicutes bacterium]|nr:cysteine synthase A [Bacillota bacterium]